MLENRMSSAIVWDYFDIGDRIAKKAICRCCDRTLSFKTTTTNLKYHLRTKHYATYEELCRKQKVARASKGHSNGADSDSTNEEESFDYLAHFEQETGGKVRCKLCLASRSNNIEDMKRHLKVKHPKLIDDPIQVAELEHGDEIVNDDDQEQYTEVIYIEEDNKQKLKPKSPHKKIKEKPKIIYRTRRTSEYSDTITPKRPKRDDSQINSASNELDSFLNYVRCLLNEMPRDVSVKLQADIITMIVNAKINASEAHTSDNSVVNNLNSYTIRLERDDIKISNVSQPAIETESIAETSQHDYSSTNGDD